MAGRKPEFHLYLHSFEGFKKDIINANTITECKERMRDGKDIDTYQVMACTTTLLVKGYDVYVHLGHRDVRKIVLGECEWFGRELRVSHNLPALIASYFVEEPENTCAGMGYSDRVRGHRIENPLTDLPLMLGGEVLTTSEMDAIIKPIEEEEK